MTKVAIKNMKNKFNKFNNAESSRFDNMAYDGELHDSESLEEDVEYLTADLQASSLPVRPTSVGDAIVGDLRCDINNGNNKLIDKDVKTLKKANRNHELLFLDI